MINQGVEYLQIKARGYTDIKERIITEDVLRSEPHTHDKSSYGCCLEGDFRINNTVYYPGDFFEVLAGEEHTEVSSHNSKILIGSK